MQVVQPPTPISEPELGRVVTSSSTTAPISRDHDSVQSSLAYLPCASVLQVEASFGAPLEQLFTRFDEGCFASGSIAQVGATQQPAISHRIVAGCRCLCCHMYSRLSNMGQNIHWLLRHGIGDSIVFQVHHCPESHSEME